MINPNEYIDLKGDLVSIERCCVMIRDFNSGQVFESERLDTSKYHIGDVVYFTVNYSITMEQYIAREVEKS